MTTKTFFASSLALAGATLALATPANALTFNWSFVTDRLSTGGPGQTISGTISGLVEGNNDGTGLTVTVDSTPTGELTGGGWSFIDTFNGGPAFTVTGGAVTFADALFGRNDDDDQVFFGGFDGYNPALFDFSDFNPSWVAAFPNTFTPVGTPAVPEPGSALALLGLGALGIIGRKLKR